MAALRSPLMVDWICKNSQSVQCIQLTNISLTLTGPCPFSMRRINLLGDTTLSLTPSCKPRQSSCIRRLSKITSSQPDKTYSSREFIFLFKIKSKNIMRVTSSEKLFDYGIQTKILFVLHKCMAWHKSTLMTIISNHCYYYYNY